MHKKICITDVHIYSRVGVIIIMPDALITDVNNITLYKEGTINLITNTLYLNINLSLSPNQK